MDLPVSLEVFARLGGASRQAAQKSGDPARWLRARLRRALGRGRPGSARHAFNVAKAAAQAHLRRARERLQAWGQGPGGGRPRRADPAALAEALGTEHRAGDTLIAVYARWVADLVADLGRLARRPGRPRGWRALVPWLDRAWLPRWVSRATGAGSAPEGRRFERRAEEHEESLLSDGPAEVWDESDNEPSLLYD